MEAMTDRVTLREVLASDLPVFYADQRDPDATRMAAFPGRDRETFMAHWNRILADDTIVLQTVLVDGQVAGNLICFGEDDHREVGYWISKPFWGRGVATRALAAFLQLVTTRPLYAHVAGHNLASRRVLEKCGFIVIGEGSWTEPVHEEEIKGVILKLAGEHES